MVTDDVNPPPPTHPLLRLTREQEDGEEESVMEEVEEGWSSGAFEDVAPSLHRRFDLFCTCVVATVLHWFMDFSEVTTAAN